MKKIKIGVLISNNENKVIGYSFEKGFFICKGLFFQEDFHKNNLDNETIWFSNIKEENITHQNVKSNDFFGIKITDMIVHHGLYNIKINNQPNFKIILKKIYDMLSPYVENHLEAFKKTEIEKVNPKAIMVREDKRIKSFILAKSYKSLLLSIKDEYNENLITNIINEDEKSYKVIPHYFYNNNAFRDESTSKISSILKSRELHKKEMSVLNRKTSELTLNTMDFKALRSIGEKDFLDIKNYKISSLGNSYNLDKKNKDILKIEEVLFYLIKIQKTPDVRVFKSALNTAQWVSKKELEFYLLNDFSISIEYICEKINEEIKPSFLFNVVSLQDAVNEHFERSYYHQIIHSYNYLQIIELSDNNILNKWIKSALKSNTMEMIRKLENSDIEVIEYDYDYIKISYDNRDSERLRAILEELEIKYPSVIL